MLFYNILSTAFVPQITSVSSSSQGTAVTAHTVNIPAVSTGNTGILFLVFGRDGSNLASDTATTPTGWEVEYTYGGPSGNSRLRIIILSRIYNGSEGASVSITTSGTCRHGCIGVALNCPARVSTGTASVYQDTAPTTVDFPTHTMPTSGVPTLWCSWMGMNSASALTSTIDSYPSGYDLFQNTIMGSASGLGSARSAVAFRYINSIISTPGSASLSNTHTVYTNTIAIRKQ